MIRGSSRHSSSYPLLKCLCRYIITELNTNSAIAYPDHDETLDLQQMTPDAEYTIKGYAYAGGGRRVQRVEISLDGGSLWKLADIAYPEVGHDI